MTIDERLGALAQSLELVAQLQQQTEKELNKLTREVRNFRREVHTFRSIAQAMLLDHEERLRELEDGDGNEDSEEPQP